MSSEPSQTHVETLHPAIEEAIEAADLFLTSLEEQTKLGFSMAQAETKIMPFDHQHSPPKDDAFLGD